MSTSNNNFNGQNTSSDTVPWIVVGICLLAFWPVGLVLLIKKLNSENTAGRAENRHSGQTAWRQDWQAETDKWRHQWHTESNKWRQDWRAGNWGKSVERFFNSLFNTTVDSSQASSTYKGYYRQPYEQEQEQQSQQQSARDQYAPGQEKPALRPIPEQRSHKSHQRPQEPLGASQSQSYSQQRQHAADASETANQQKRSRKGLSIALSLLGVLLGLGGVILMALGASQYAVYGLSVSNLLVFILGTFSLVGGLSCFITRNVLIKRMNLFKKYAAIIGDADIASISDISRKAGDPDGKTRRTVQLMINAGYFGAEAYIDNDLGLVRSYTAAEKQRAGDASARQPGDSETGGGNTYVTIINELHMLCVQTVDPIICAKIQRIEDLTAKIFRTVEEHPEKKSQVRRFLNIYLPTTIKLLHSYQTLERQGVSGDNIQSAKQDIERILDTLITGFEQQLDQLFMTDKLDISSDINVLENLMQQDGLTGDQPFFKTAGGH